MRAAIKRIPFQLTSLIYLGALAVGSNGKKFIHVLICDETLRLDYIPPIDLPLLREKDRE